MPLLLDLFCGAGGCSVGYARAGWQVVGVDLVGQPDYPFRIFRGDALRFPLDGFDAVHASPPCTAFTQMRVITAGRDQLRLFDPHSDLLTPMLERLEAWGGPWIVENVPTAPMPASSLLLCGSSFGLRVRRHRLFASNVPLTAPPCDHAGQGQSVGVYGHGGAWAYRDKDGGKHGLKVVGEEAAEAMGVEWTDYQPSLAQMIPPAYTEHLGRQLLAAQKAGSTLPPKRFDREGWH